MAKFKYKNYLKSKHTKITHEELCLSVETSRLLINHQTMKPPNNLETVMTITANEFKSPSMAKNTALSNGALIKLEKRILCDNGRLV